tara:strand:- start:359 stop:496 length:138 start_codon:yes stop_codon:yes gene_type:complete
MFEAIEAMNEAQMVVKLGWVFAGMASGSIMTLCIAELVKSYRECR